MVVIRLSRAGAKKRPFYHICVSDRRKARDGSFIEKIGFYNPIAKDGEEKIKLDHERFEYWKSVGAIPSDTVKMLFERSNMSEEDIAKLEQKKSEQKQKRKEKAILEKQKSAEEEAPAEEATSADGAAVVHANTDETPAEEEAPEEEPAEEPKSYGDRLRDAAVSELDTLIK